MNHTYPYQDGLRPLSAWRDVLASAMVAPGFDGRVSFTTSTNYWELTLVSEEKYVRVSVSYGMRGYDVTITFTPDSPACALAAADAEDWILGYCADLSCVRRTHGTWSDLVQTRLSGFWG